MKRFSSIRKFPLLLLLIIGGLFLLTACDDGGEPLPRTETAELETVGDVKHGASRYRMVQDVKTGCQYIELSTGLAPYYDESGKVKGCKGNSLTVQP